MMKTINTEVAAILLVGFVLTVSGIYLNFRNLDMSTVQNIDYNVLKTNEGVYTIVQLLGVAIIFIGVMRGLIRRADIMTGKFVNIMDVFTSLIRREMDVMKDQDRRRRLTELEEKSEMFKRELGGMKRL